MDWLSSGAIGERRTKTLLQCHFFKLLRHWLSYFAHANQFGRKQPENENIQMKVSRKICFGPRNGRGSARLSNTEQIPRV
jgi:hypothetical protein